MTYNKVYGKYTLGGGSWINKKHFKKIDTNIFNEDILDSFQTMVLQDLCRMNIDKKINKMSVMNTGSGREAIAFENLNAKSIDLVDISKENCQNLKKYKNKNNSNINIYNLDIGGKKFSNIKKKYDLIYLNGVIHHTKNPNTSLYNIANKIKDDGLVWIYFYQFGSPYNIVRKLLKLLFWSSKISQKNFYEKIKKIFSPKSVERTMDDIGCDYAYILPSSYYLNIMKILGFKMIYNKDFYLKTLPSIRLSTPSALCAFKKNKNKSSKNLKDILSQINYDYNLYDISEYNIDDREFISNLEKKYIKIKNILDIKLTETTKILNSCYICIEALDNFHFLDSNRIKKNNLNNLHINILKQLS